MTPTLSIVSPGLLDPQALSLMGASTKRDDPTQIGRFGSGLKYALAYFLRNNYEINVHIGARKIPITTQEVNLRGQKFSQILIDGKPTSLTTTLGPDWVLWQAIRELYCNALDEGAKAPLTFGPIAPGTACTAFRIRGAGLEEIYNNRETYFSTDPARVLHNEPGIGKILRKVDASQRIYRKGILASVRGKSISLAETPHTSAFDYDLDNIKLNENRAPDSDWDVFWEMGRLIATCNAPSMVATYASIGNEDFKRGFQANSGSGLSWSDAWRAHLSERPLVCPMLLGAVAASDLARCRIVSDACYMLACDNNLGTPFMSGKGGKSYVKVPIESHQRAAIHEALNMFLSIGMPITHTIEIGRFASKDTMGMADDNTIILAETCFFRGIQYVVETIIEEEIHLTEQVHDSTRAMQDALIRYAAKAIMARPR